MKKATLVLTTLAGLTVYSWAAPNTNTPSAPADTPYQVVERGANHQVWRKESYERQTNGKLVKQVHQYTELASGLNYWHNGQWTPAREKIEVYAGGAVARQGQHQVIFANNLNSYGAIDMQMPNERRLRSNLLGLMYYDSESGETVLLARLQNSEGQVVSDNQVIYPNAFEGLKADVRYTYTKAGLEQDVILQENPASPEAYGLNPATTELEVFTEFINPPTVTVRDLPPDGSTLESDQEVDWDGVRLGKGKAFNLGGEADAASVAKRYVTIQGRHFLLEKVAVKDVRKSLSKLPDQASNVRRQPMMAGKSLILPAAPKLSAAAKPMKMALGATPDRGYVLDYVSLSSAATNYTFLGDTCYYISGNLNLYGTNTFEGGTVIKYAANASIAVIPGQSVVFKTSDYLPVLFTAVDDNSLSETIGTGTPSGYYGNPALSLPSAGNLQISGARFLYASQAIAAPGTALTLNNVQFVNCGVGVSAAGNAVVVNNGLFENVNTNLVLLGTNTVISANQVTFNNTRVLAAPAGSYPAGSSLQLTNCVLANVANVAGNVAGGYNGFYRTAPFGGPAYTNTFYPFNVVGAGSCYLTNGCAFLDRGTPNLNASLLATLQRRTVYPPMVYSGVTLSNSLTFYPLVARDTNTPDLGYHYEPLDYVFGAVNLTTNLTFTAGTVMGWYVTQPAAGSGILIYDGNRVTFNGTATNPCRCTRYGNVQEGGNGMWTANGWGWGLGGTGSGEAYPQVVFNHTVSSTFSWGNSLVRDDGFPLVVQANNSEFYGCGMAGYILTIFSTNCLFVRCDVGNNCDNSWYPYPQMVFNDCTFYNGTFCPTRQEDGDYGLWQATWPVWVANCAFDYTAINVPDFSYGDTSITYCDFNAFLTSAANVNELPKSGTNNVYVTSFNWQSNWLGNYYLPGNSPLINRGSVLASQLGLYHFTTQTNQVKEGSSQLDIGYHYVAVNANGAPVDTDGDGVADYLEDANGNGLVDAGESNWNDSGVTVSNTMVVGWLDDTFEQSDVPSGLTNVLAVSAGEYHSLALKRDGTVASWGDVAYDVPADLTNAVAVCAGYAYSIAVRSDGTLVAWGDNTYGGLNLPAGLAGVQSVAAGWSHAAALLTNGTVVAWGDNSSGQTNVPTDLTNATMIAACANHSLALKRDGTVEGWGANWHNELDIPAGLTNAVAVAAGIYHTVALRRNGTVLAWGDDSYGQTDVPAGLTNVVAIAASWWHSVALKSDGTVVVWGDENGIEPSPVVSYDSKIFPTGGLNHVIAIAAAKFYALAIRSGSLTPVITQEPVDQYVQLGDDATFTVKGAGLYGVGYQWQKNGVNLPGATAETITVTNVQSAALADSYAAMVTDAGGMGSLISSNVSIHLLPPPVIVSQSPPATNLVVRYLTNVTLGVAASAPAVYSGFPLSYQWQYDGMNIDGATASSYAFTATATAAGHYTVQVSNAAGSTSADWRVTVVTTNGIQFLLQPTNQYQIAGGSSSYACAAISSNAVTYQWQFNGADIRGETNYVLIQTNVQAAQQGYYHCVVNDGISSRTSSNAWFYLVTAPAVASQSPPANFVAIYQTNLTLSVTISAVGQTNGFPVGYQWQLNGMNIAGANAASYAFSAEKEGTYSVLITNLAGSTSASWLVGITFAGSYIAPGTLAYHLSTNLVVHTNGFSDFYQATLVLSGWSYQFYNAANLPLLTNSTWSTNFWLNGVKGLSATCIGYSNGLAGQGLITMVSPRHYLFATHMHPEGLWAAFLDTNNVLYWRKTLERVDVQYDTSVGILDADLPPAVGYLPILPPDFGTYLPTNYASCVQGVGMDQFMQIFAQPMTFGGNFVNWNIANACPFGVTTNWNKLVVPGDSSDPEMIMIGNRLVLVSHNYTAGSGPNYALQIPLINQYMHYLSTNNAVGTDYQLTLFPLTSWPSIR